MTRDPKVLVDCFVPGRPHSTKSWVNRVIDVTVGQPRIVGACELEVEFLLPSHRDSWVTPSETRLSSVLKVLLDTLEGTVLRDTLDRPDRDKLVAVRARTKVARPGEEEGTRIILRRASVPG